MTPGNRLYLYQLLSTKIGIGRQVPLSQVEELLDKDGIDVMSLGYEDVREFVEELDDFMRLTVFKKGRVYATVTTHEAFDAILARLNESAATSGKDAGEGAATTAGKPTGAKTWKHRKSNKDPKPAKPRVRIRREARRKSDPDPEAVVEAASGTIGGDAEEPTPSPEPEPRSEPQVEPEPEPEPEGDDRRAKDHVSTEGHISINITYNPYDYGELYLEDEGLVTESVEAQPEQGGTGGADPVSCTTEDSAHAAKDPSPAAPTGGAATRQRYELFQSFSHDVWCKDEPLSLLYQVLPYDIEPMSVLEDDWRYAHSTSTYEGTHSSIRFPLSFRASGSERPIVAQLHRSVKLHAGKAWALEAIDLGGVGDAALQEEALPLVGSDTRPNRTTQLERDLAKLFIIGSWESYLGELANLAAKECWGARDTTGLTTSGLAAPGGEIPPELSILCEYLALTLRRVREEGQLLVSHDGQLAAFNTGLLSTGAEAIFDVLLPNEGDIRWRHAGFCMVGSGELGTLLSHSLDEPPRAASYLTSLDEVTLRPRAHVELGEEVRSQLGDSTDDTVEKSVRRVRSSYRLLVPAYDPAPSTHVSGSEGGDVVSLLPLWGEDPTQPKEPGEPTEALLLRRAKVKRTLDETDGMASGVDGTADGLDAVHGLDASPHYVAEELLPPAQAYSRARAICADLPSWLTSSLDGD